MLIYREAKNYGLLYHITNYNGLRKIYETNQFRRNRMSLTRYSQMWTFNGAPAQPFFKLVFDGAELSDKYKLRPYAMRYVRMGSEGNQTAYYDEGEEEIQDTKGRYFLGITKCIKRIIFNNIDFERTFKLLGGDPVNPDPNKRGEYEKFSLSTDDYGIVDLSDLIGLVRTIRVHFILRKGNTPIIKYLESFIGQEY